MVLCLRFLPSQVPLLHEMRLVWVHKIREESRYSIPSLGRPYPFLISAHLLPSSESGDGIQLPTHLLSNSAFPSRFAVATQSQSHFHAAH